MKVLNNLTLCEELTTLFDEKSRIKFSVSSSGKDPHKIYLTFDTNCKYDMHGYRQAEEYKDTVISYLKANGYKIIRSECTSVEFSNVVYQFDLYA